MFNNKSYLLSDKDSSTFSLPQILLIMLFLPLVFHYLHTKTQYVAILWFMNADLHNSSNATSTVSQMNRKLER